MGLFFNNVLYLLAMSIGKDMHSSLTIVAAYFPFQLTKSVVVEDGSVGHVLQ